MDYTVGEVARLAGVSVRTLHHYDELGLVTAGRRVGGHRTYDQAALERLQQVLFFRALGFRLDDIGRIIGDPQFDRRAALERQRELMIRKLARTREVLAAIEEAIAAEMQGGTVPPEDMFGGFDPADYADEVKQRWGTTGSYREAGRRTSSYSKDDWKQIKRESEEIVASLAELMRSGARSDSAEATAAAEAHRLHIDRWYYPCSPHMHLALGETYAADPRFTAHYDKVERGLAVFIRDAITANAGEV